MVIKINETHIHEDVICVLGVGHVGLPLVAALANVGYKVIGCDTNSSKIENLQKTYEADIHEPNLTETLQNRRNNIVFTTDHKYAIKNSSVIIITVGTPLNSDNSPDYSSIDHCIEHIGKHLKKNHLIILKSTVVPGTTEDYVKKKLEEISKLKAGEDFYLAFCPERTIEGMALYELYTLPKIIGGINKESTERAVNILEKLGEKIIKVSSPKVAEVCKIMDNLYRTLNIAIANELGIICEQDNIDANEVVTAVNTAYERTRLFKPGLGADGPCLSKDPEILKYYAKKHNIKTEVLDATIESNKRATMRIADIVSEFIEKKINSCKIALVGLAFKGEPETADIRGSPALKIFNELTKKYNNISFSTYDPIVKKFPNLEVSNSLSSCIENVNVILLLNNHISLRNIDLNMLLKKASRPLLIVDCWKNIKNIKDVKEDVYIFRVGSGWETKKF